MAGLKLSHLCKNYQGIQAVQDASFEATEKKFIVLAGPSGCGKTTLLHMIAGLLDYDCGEVYIDGVNMKDIKAEKRGIAMVFQDAALFEHLRVFDNIAIGLSYLGWKREAIEQQVRYYAKMLRIEALLERKASTLSNGQKQRVSIARALIRNPRLILMDEALSALDARLKSQLRIEIAQLYQQMDTTFLYVTHDQVEAMTLAETLIVMKDGCFQQIGNPMEIYQNPCNMFVADFLGKYEMNKFEGHILKEQLLYKEKHIPALGFADQDIVIGIRPENIRFNEEGFCGKVVLIENLGDDIYYHVAYESSIIIIKGNGYQTLHVNDSIRFSFSLEEALCFNKQTGERLYIK